MHAMRQDGRQGGHRKPSIQSGRMLSIMRLGSVPRQWFVLVFPLDRTRGGAPSVARELQKKRKAAMLPVCACCFSMHKVLYCNAAR
jgi:hypothetical protein